MISPLGALNQATRWDALDASKYLDEAEAVQRLLTLQPLSPEERVHVQSEAARLVTAARGSARQRGIVESFLQEFSLGTGEGLALMCLAEAVLRTPDAKTRDRLIAEKIGTADWASHIGQSQSLFVNASAWGLMMTGKLVEVEEGTKRDVSSFLRRLTARLGEPVVRQAVAGAVRIMGEQFVLGRDIGCALKRAKRNSYLCSFDMLGEGARTPADAERFEQIYALAIEAVGKHRSAAHGPEDGHGISVKLSALGERYDAVQETRVWRDLYPRLKRLAIIAARYNLNLAIDAEEADRLVLSLKIVERLLRETELDGWTGLGVVVQAYQKRGLAVIVALRELSRETGRRIMVRLVKGAYWDSEIKRAQVTGRPDYPVFTTKPATDLSYLVCAATLIEASPCLYPQFATHNAHTLASVLTMAARANTPIECQRLHGMGEALYRQAGENLKVRAYAPVGGHQELLPYLVRRLLENGANTSFVHALLDPRVPVDMVVADPIALVEAWRGPHPKIPKPEGLFGAERINPLGRDYSILAVRKHAAETANSLRRFEGGPIVGGIGTNGTRPVTSPAHPTRVLGHTVDTTNVQIQQAVQLARTAQLRWDLSGGPARADVLRAMGNALDRNMDELVALLTAEAGKTLNDGVAEVCEAIDFCRYYAHLAEQQFAGANFLTGPVGETNTLELRGRGIFVCISPWNFPLAIFTGQVAAALAAGNAVLAKPAEQTPLVAAAAVRLFHLAGLHPDLLAFVPGDGATVGKALVEHPCIAGVAFTGGMDTARAINRVLADRPGAIVPFIAETGGLNGMFVDTTALREQVVDDVLVSAFGSAGQRCSALRLLCVPRDGADALIETLSGALDAMVIGDPADPATDIGPVIDGAASAVLERHISRLRHDAKVLHRAAPSISAGDGYYCAPVIAEIPAPDFLKHEVFGPILHIYRYDTADLPVVARNLAACGYGLTLGIHSRIDGFAREIRELVPAGNVYVNRSMTGAMVGVQPFGGEGLSGTGPKAGGPHALLRYAVERVVTVNIAAMGGDPALLNL